MGKTAEGTQSLVPEDRKARLRDDGHPDDEDAAGNYVEEDERMCGDDGAQVGQKRVCVHGGPQVTGWATAQPERAQAQARVHCF
jgi:hypothetical protein